MNDRFLETGDTELRKASPVRKVLPDFTTTVVNVPPLDTLACKKISGRYEVPGRFTVIIKFDNGKLLVTPPGGSPVRLYPTSASEYFSDAADVQITFNTT